MTGGEEMNTLDTTGMYYTGIMPDTENYETKPLAHEQLKSRPKIDDVICQYLEGESLKEALIVINNVRAGRMKIKWSSVNTWSVHYRRKHVCDIRLENGSWSIRQVCEYINTCKCYMSYDPESMKRLISALRDSITVAHTACHATP